MYLGAILACVYIGEEVWFDMHLEYVSVTPNSELTYDQVKESNDFYLTFVLGGMALHPILFFI